ncbi:5-oxoprolinase subunit PxpA [Propionivibrio sp.]|uniref:LamB/YcsF family protein n=1 Tax=Propionivibrio sp. TaxID=2212460 RepID=UPI0025CC01C9|nr:5-oxoprolinase subunit PxpA [Propionivibrio sp.]
MPTMRLNLNADLGEGYGPWSMGDDAAMLEIVASANIACGGHAGDPETMRRTVRLAQARGVSIGAHPSYPDLQGFGRRAMTLSPAELEGQIAFQIGALAGVASLEAAQVTHVKPHGALNNLASIDRGVADTVCRAIRAIDRRLILLAPAASQLLAAGHAAGLNVLEEIFADRAYLPDGQLVPRSRPDALIHGAEACLAHTLAMLEAGALIAVNGARIATAIASICVHGDNPDAVGVARHLRQALVARGYQIVPLPEIAI